MVDGGAEYGPHKRNKSPMLQREGADEATTGGCGRHGLEQNEQNWAAGHETGRAVTQAERP